ncbi:MAG: hypothetical protein ABIN18_18010 [Pseudomonadota bacterium]
MIEVIGVILIIVLVDFTARFARLVKPLRNMSDKVTEESQRIRFEVAKIAEEIAVIRKNLQKDSVDQEIDLKT